MKNFLTISRYKFWIIILYLVVFPFFFAFTPDVIYYGFSTVHLGKVLFIIAVACLGFYLLNALFHFRKIKWQNFTFFQVILVAAYAALFAVPEEIIFRGIIQGAIQDFTNNVFIVVVASSAIFGFAHLPNGANGFHPKNWNWELAGMAFLAGLPLGLIFSITNSLLIPTVLHAAFLILFSIFLKKPKPTSSC